MLRCVLLASAAVFSIPAFAQQSLPPVELEEITVSANLTPTPSREVGSAVTVITREELEQRQIRFVSDALRSVPGVNVNTTGAVGNLTQVRIRGSEANHTLVLIDGVEVNSPASTEGGFDFANLMGLDVERIEVLRGPQSALYGSDAVGGVVNIITRRGEGPARVSGFAEGGSQGTAAGGASLGGSTERADYFFSATGFRTDGFSSAAEWRGNDEKDGYENGNLFGKFGFRVNENLRFDVIARGTDYFSESDLFGASEAVDGDAHTEGQQGLAHVRATLDLLDGRWQQIFAASHYSDKYDYFESGSLSSAYRGDKTKLDYRSTFDLSSEALPDITQSVTFAVDHESVDTDVESIYVDLDRTREQTGVVGQYQVGIWDQLFLTGSIRHDFNEAVDDETTYRFTGSYVIDETNTKFRASLGTGVKDPTLYELYGAPGLFPVLPNPDLKPERSRGWDAGIDQAFFNSRLVFDATYFEQEIEDYITFGSTGAPNFDTIYVNADGITEISGVELGVTVRPFDAVSVRAAYTWLDGEEADGEALLRRPEHTVSLDINYGFLDGRANLNLGIVYLGEREDLAFLPGPTRVDLDSYVLVNLRGSYRVTENAEVYGRIENLFDEEYEETYSYGSPGRLGIAGMRVTF